MKILKVLPFLGLVTVLAFSSASTNTKERIKISFSKEELAGKWSSVITNDGYSVDVKIEIKSSGTFELESFPYDAMPEFCGVWGMNGNKFTAWIPFTSDKDIVLFEGLVDFPNLIIKPSRINKKLALLTGNPLPKPNACLSK